MKRLICLMLLLVPVFLKSQSCNYYFNLSKGDQLVYHHFDKKEKLSSISMYEFTAIKQQEDKMEGTLKTVMKDNKGKLITEAAVDVTCEDGVLYVDMQSFLNPEMMETYKEMDMTLQGDQLGFPSEMKAGDKLEDGSINIKVQSGGMTMANITVTISDRKVEAKEDVKTPAGTFKCYKIRSTSVTDMMIKIESESVEWYSPEIGLVQSETYDKRGRLSSKTVLQEIKK